MSYNTSSSPLKPDIEDIIDTHYSYKPYFLVSTILHTAEKDLEFSEGIYVSSISFTRNYLEHISDYIEIEMICKLGTYIYDVYPYADNLEMTVSITKQKRFNGINALVETERYKAIYLAEKNNQYPTNAAVDRNELDKQPPITITFQLVEQTVMALRTVQTQGVFDNVISEDNKEMGADSLIKSIMSKETDEILIDNRPCLDKIQIEKPSNQEPMTTVVIPSGTNLLDVPEYLQEKCGGVYAAGMKKYIQKFAESPSSNIDKTFFVYSAFDGLKFHDSEFQIIFVIPPSGEYNTLKSTYKYRAKTLKVLTNPIQGLESTKGNLLRSEGDGFRTTNANSFVGSPIEITENGPSYKKTQMVTEMIDKPQPDGLNYAPYKGISGNHFVNTTEVLARRGEYVNLNIDHLDKDFIFPGAPCMLLYEVGDGVVQELYGVIHTIEFKYYYPKFDPIEEAVKDTHALTTKTILNVYITDPDKVDESAGTYF